MSAFKSTSDASGVYRETTGTLVAREYSSTAPSSATVYCGTAIRQTQPVVHAQTVTYVEQLHPSFGG